MSDNAPGYNAAPLNIDPMSAPPAPRPSGRSAPPEFAVELADVTFAYDRRPVLTGISMAIPRGGVVAIMGGSGCGKTTILRLIGGQLKPKSGRVLVDGESVPDLDREALYVMRRKFGMLFQFGALFTDMSVYENIAFALREHTDLPGGAHPRPRADEAARGRPCAARRA